jgi:hypothetical protein
MTEGGYTGPERRAHGQRRTYQAGCRCLTCKAANASYIQTLRTETAKGRIPVGRLVNAKEAGQHIRALLVERYTRRQVLVASGLSYGTLPKLNATHLCRLKTLLRLRRAASILLAEESLNTLNTTDDATRREAP